LTNNIAPIKRATREVDMDKRLESYKGVCDAVESRGWRFLTPPELFVNRASKGDFKCNNEQHAPWNATIQNVLTFKSSCPSCKGHKAELMTMFIAQHLTGATFVRNTRRVLANGLELDGYNEYMKLGIEYMGAQHYVENVKFFHREEGSFEAQQRRDEEKLAQCKAQGINLIRIHYSNNTFEKIKDELIKQLTELGYIYATGVNWEELHNEFCKIYQSLYDDEKGRIFMELQKLAEERGGECLESVYKGHREKMFFQCGNGHIFRSTKDALTRIEEDRERRWCKFCAPNAPVPEERRVNIAASINATFLEKLSLTGQQKWEYEGSIPGKEPTASAAKRSRVYLKVSCNAAEHVTLQLEENMTKNKNPDKEEKVYCCVCREEELAAKKLVKANRPKRQQRKKKDDEK
jgi:hypothetical protein